MRESQAISTDGIEVIELEVEEIEINGLVDKRIQSEKPRVQQTASKQYDYLPVRQMVA